MASIKFYLTRPEAKEQTSIFFLLNYGMYEIVSGKKKYIPLKYYTDVSIRPEYWNAKTGRARETKSFPQHPEFNERLNGIEHTALSLLNKLRNEGITLTNDILKKDIDRIYNKDINDITEVAPAGIELMQYVEHFIKASNKKESTKKSYKVVQRDLTEYQQKRKVKLSFQKIDIDFYNDFVKFLKSKDYAPNTIGTRIKILKTFLSNADEAGLPVSRDYTKRAFAKPREETESIYLNETELTAMYSLNLERAPKLDRVRDLFLIGAYTGLRFSDLSQLNKDNIGDGMISIRTIKTGAVVKIPVHTRVGAILGKYEGSLPKVPSNQKFNEYIKEVAKCAGIEEPARIEKTQGNLTSKTTESKCNMVTAHTARRSFATNAYLNDIPSISIMKITGHKT
ncbi:MAG: site-specific integrase, partial [Prevotellaceae bacterium]|nr:site-specific integrase [Prevotellaceae bacterium]